MAEITNSEEWLKAATDCVLEHWCDADESESGPKDSRAPEWTHGVRPKDEFIQGLERLINGDPDSEPEVVAVSENLPDYEDLPLEVIELTPTFQSKGSSHINHQ